MTASYPMGDACRDAVASGAMLRARTAAWQTAHGAVSGAPRPRAKWPAPIAPSARAVADMDRWRPVPAFPPARRRPPVKTRPSNVPASCGHKVWTVSRASCLKAIYVKYPQIRCGDGRHGGTSYSEFRPFASRTIGGSQSSRST
jgi:hypothetical protein